MKTMNEIVQARLGAMSMSMCEAEIVISGRDARIAELEAEVESLKQRVAEKNKRSTAK